ncbi:MAG: HAMP domain-containing histidine kinase, partial [Clostridia bacterium]|nr:HAMP domain-containing histidine kinase [Clostridia bacterium]
MLTKLRRRFIMDTMVLALIILVGSTALLITASYTYAKNSADDRMSDALKNITEETVTVKKGKDGKKTAVLQEDVYEYHEDVAILILSDKGDVLDMEVPGKSLRDKIDEDIDTIVPFVLARKNSKGLVAALPLRYAKAPLKGIGTKGALMDRTQEIRAVYFQFRLYIVLAFIIIILLLAVCDYLARRSIFPVDEAIRTQQQFIADASHELKTPLTVILANLDIISSHPERTVKESERWLENTESEAKRMSKLVNEMLFLARSDAAMDMKYNFRLIAFNDVVDEVVLATEALAFDRNITLESELDENSRVVGDVERLKQVVM